MHIDGKGTVQFYVCPCESLLFISLVCLNNLLFMMITYILEIFFNFSKMSNS